MRQTMKRTPETDVKTADAEVQSESKEVEAQVGENGTLARNLQSRHMQMIAIGGSIGAGLFVGSGEAFSNGGPGSVLIGFIMVGFMLLFTTQALGELAVLYPVNGAFFSYAVRFIDPAWGFAMGCAEASDPRKTLPQATKQVFWRITFFYVVTLFLIGLIVPSNDPRLLHASGGNTSASPFVLAISNAHISVLPSIFNAVITISVLSVANSCTFGSTRTIQALAAQGMAPKILAYVDRRGRPIPCVILQLCFGLLAFIGEASAESTIFTWLLSLSGLAFFFAWASICLSHIRFRAGWKAQGHSLDELPFKAKFGVIGSYIGLALVCLAVIATFYISIFPVGSTPTAEGFFQEYLAAPLTIALYLFWKIYTRGRGGLFVRAQDMDLTTGMRHFEHDIEIDGAKKKGLATLPLRFIRSFF